jgi:hypothetical protein
MPRRPPPQRHGRDKDHRIVFVIVVVVVIAVAVATGGRTMTIPPPPPPLAADRRTPWKRDGRRQRQRCVPSTIACSVMGGEDIATGAWCLIMMCGSDFPMLPVQAYGRNSTKAEIYLFLWGRDKSFCRREKSPQKNKSIELGRNCSSSAERTKNLGAPNGNQEIQFPSHLPLVLLGLSFFALIMLGSITLTSK